MAFRRGLFFLNILCLFFLSGLTSSLFAAPPYDDSSGVEVNLIVMGCNNNLICEPISGETIGSCPLDCTPPATTTPPTVSNIPTSAPWSGGSGGSSSTTTFTFSPFTLNAGTSTASITWSTSMPTASVISWGKGADFESGSVSENSLRYDHAIQFESLQPDTVYSIMVSATNIYGKNQRVAYTFRSLTLQDELPPANVTNFRIRPSFGGNAELVWDNPTEDDFVGVVITRGTKFFPTSPSIGYKVYEGNNERALDTNTIPRQYYFYTAFSKDRKGNLSSGSLAEYYFVSEAVPVTPPMITQPVLGGKVIVGTTTLSDVLFFQNDISIYPENGQIILKSNVAVVVRVPAQFVPKNIEQAFIRVFDEKKGESVFMLQRQSDGSLVTVIPGFENDGKFAFSVVFMARGIETHVRGNFLVKDGEIYVYRIYADEPSAIPEWITFFILIFLVILMSLRKRFFAKRKSGN